MALNFDYYGRPLLYCVVCLKNSYNKIADLTNDSQMVVVYKGNSLCNTHFEQAMVSEEVEKKLLEELWSENMKVFEDALASEASITHTTDAAKSKRKKRGRHAK